MENKQKIKLIDVAFFISTQYKIASSIRLQKIIFFIYENSLKGNFSFNINEKNAFQAWVYGPVNESIYKKFKDNNFSFDDNFKKQENIFELNNQISSEINDFLIKNKISNMSNNELIEKSHLNNGWINARKKAGVYLSPTVNSREVILDEEIIN